MTPSDFFFKGCRQKCMGWGYCHLWGGGEGNKKWNTLHWSLCKIFTCTLRTDQGPIFGAQRGLRQADAHELYWQNPLLEIRGSFAHTLVEILYRILQDFLGSYRILQDPVGSCKFTQDPTQDPKWHHVV